MSEEEKKAIKYLEFLSNEKCECEVCQNAKKQYKIILNLIEEQQKEIEEYKETINVLKPNLEELIEMSNFAMQKDYVSKDKIRKTIEDLEKHTIINADKFTIKVLKDLIGE